MSTKNEAIESISDLLTQLKKLSALPQGGLRAFRGIRNSAWNAEPGIFRSQHTNLLLHEKDAVREIVSVRPNDFANDQGMFDRLVRMQHFELPTRLLDVTINPLVALYFACEEVDNRIEDSTDGAVQIFSIPPERQKYFDSDTVSCISNLANLSKREKEAIAGNLSPDRLAFNQIAAVDRLCQFIRSEKPYFRPEINSWELNKPWYVTPKLSNSRIIAQSGAFIIFGLTPIDTENKYPIKNLRVLVSKANKKLMREELNILGINQRSLFPEIDKAAQYIKARYE